MPFNPDSLHHLRRSLHLTQSDLARLLGYRQQTVCSLERGKSSPSIEMLDALYRLCRIKGVPPPLFYVPPGLDPEQDDDASILKYLFRENPIQS